MKQPNLVTIIVCKSFFRISASMATNDGQGTYSGRLKPFMAYRTRYSTLSTLKERTNSNSSIATLTGSLLLVTIYFAKMCSFLTHICSLTCDVTRCLKQLI